MIDWINDAFEDAPVWKIRERATIQKALETKVSLQEYDDECDMAETFRDVADNLTEQLTLAEVTR